MVTKPSRREQKGVAALATAASRWAALDDPSLLRRVVYGDSVVKEFAAGHDPSAVMRELIQNEYDAHGKRLDVAFGQDSLIVTGDGDPIDEDGWRRLSVMLGTGRIAGSGYVVKPKVNGIGSKNFGLRSLFQFGDRIYVASGGKQTDIKLDGSGSPPDPVDDPATQGHRGVYIEVPYRKGRAVPGLDQLQPFTIENERLALANFVERLTPTIIKLSQPGARKSLRTVTVTSVRHNRQMQWTQSVRQERASQPGITVVRRTIRIDDTASERPLLRSELEFQKSISVPSEYRGHSVPDYFKSASGRIRIAVSIPVHRTKVRLEDKGIFFYPIGIGQGYTGTVVGVCAPFEMDADRSQMLSPETSPWNHWLLDAAVDLTLQLLVTEWHERFGVEAYLALHKVTDSAMSYYEEAIGKRLATDAVWPTRARQQGKAAGKVRFARAKDLVIPDGPDLDGFLSSEKYLASELASVSGTVDMARTCGATRFTVNSLVRLRCAGRDTSQLETEPTAEEANYSYVNYPEAIHTEDWQRRCARALDAHSADLSKANRHDLLQTSSTLTASGNLGTLAELWYVDPALAGMSLVPPGEQLHPTLAQSKVFRLLSPKERRYDTSTWIADIVDRARRGDVSDEAREALYQYLLSSHRHIKPKIRAALRSAPVLRDHKGEWTAPSMITSRTAPEAKLFEPVLHFPHLDYERDEELLRSLRIERRIDGQDVVNLARYAADHVDVAAPLENWLKRNSRLVTSSVVSQLKTIPFLVSSQGGLARPIDLYIRDPEIRACIGAVGPYVGGNQADFYKRLGCMDKPRADAIVTHLLALRQQRRRPERPEIVYPALEDALRVQHLHLELYKDVPILWTDLGYAPPTATLLAAEGREIFRSAVPLVGNDVPAPVRRAYVALGASSAPKPQHWLALFKWFDTRARGIPGPVSESERRVLRRAYRRLGQTELTVPDDLRCFLDDSGHLHSRAEMRSGHLVADNDPHLADAIKRAGIAVAFADLGGVGAEDVLAFFCAMGLQDLTEVAEHIGASAREVLQSPGWFKPEDVLDKLHGSPFNSALRAAAIRVVGNVRRLDTDPTERLNQLHQITFAADIREEYRLPTGLVIVPREFLLDADRIWVSSARTWREFNNLLAHTIASIFTSNPDKQREFADLVTMLLSCRSTREMSAYLARRGIRWKPPRSRGDRTDEVEDAEKFDETIDDYVAVEEVLASTALDLVNQGAHIPVHHNVDKGEDQPEQDAEGQTPNEPEEPTLPPLEKVKPRFRTSGAGTFKASASGAQTTNYYGSGWGSSRRADDKRSRELGTRGEQLVYYHEVERVRASGRPQSEVVWVSQSEPMADHDIRSVDDDGGDIWIEVKATTGTNGRFEWSAAEFAKALAARGRYILARVYEADTDHPQIIYFKDPIAMLMRNELGLHIGSLRAEVESI